MEYLEIILIGISLAFDAFAVSVANASLGGGKKLIRLPITFAIFQGAMLLGGYFISALTFSEFTEIVDFIAFVLLAVVGINMILSARKEKQSAHEHLNFRALMLQGLATSIDALAVGVTFSIYKTDIFISAAIITLITFILCVFGIFLGKKGRNILKGKHPEIFGGAILILLALKALIFHFI